MNETTATDNAHAESAKTAPVRSGVRIQQVLDYLYKEKTGPELIFTNEHVEQIMHETGLDDKHVIVTLRRIERKKLIVVKNIGPKKGWHITFAGKKAGQTAPVAGKKLAVGINDTVKSESQSIREAVQKDIDALQQQIEDKRRFLAVLDTYAKEAR